MSTGHRITEQIGNNAFSRNERKALGSDMRIWVNETRTGNIQDLALGNNIVFEEVEDGKLKSFCGLEFLLETEWKNIPIVFVDNHNLVLDFWIKNKMQDATLIHIDQHSDMNVQPEDRSRYMNDRGKLLSLNQDRSGKNFDRLNVGNFILAAKEIGLVDKVVQVNTEYSLKKMDYEQWTMDNCGNFLIVDIDLDFWAPEMGIEEVEKSFEIVRKLMRKVDLISVATSPYFLEQERAMDLVKKIFCE